MVTLLTLSLGASAAGADPSAEDRISPSWGVTLGGTRVTIGGVDVSNASFVQVAAGSRHSIGLTEDGALFGWGDNSRGQLGNGTDRSSLVPVPVDMSGALMDKVIAQVVVGNSHSAAVTTDGHVFTWGDNSVGQLGNEMGGESLEPVPIADAEDTPVEDVESIASGDDHMLALDSSGKVYAWGSNSNSAVGNGGVGGLTPEPVEVRPSGTLPWGPVSQIAAGRNHSMAVMDGDASVYAWGANQNGELGTSPGRKSRPTSATEVNAFLAGRTVIALAGGGAHTTALLSDGGIYAWGGNDHGQLGDGSTDASLSPVLVEGTGPDGALGDVGAIAVGDANNYALNAQGALYAWGTNAHGQLGDGSEEDFATSPVEVDQTDTLFESTVSRVSGGAHHAVVIDTAGQVHTWGGNEHGQRGDGGVITASTPVRLLTHVVRFGEDGPLGVGPIVDVEAGTLSVTTPPHEGGDVEVFIEPPEAAEP